MRETEPVQLAVGVDDVRVIQVSPRAAQLRITSANAVLIRIE